MKQLILMTVFTMMVVSGCKEYFIDEGFPDPVFKGNMMEFFENDPGNWSLLVEMVRRAGLEPQFRGEVPEHPEVTFFAPTNLSIYQFLFKTVDSEGERVYAAISDIPQEMCREMLLSYVVDGNYRKGDFDYEVAGTLEGGSVLCTLNDLELRIYRTRTPVGDIPDIGPEGLEIHYKKSGHMAVVISADHVTDNGMVHALSSTFQFVNPKE